MRLERLVAQRFGNLADLDLDTNARCVVLHGDNAQGKTNFLEAIYVLATLRPWRGHRLKELVTWGDRDAKIAGWVSGRGGRRHLAVGFGESRRSCKVDDVIVRDLEEYFSAIRVIAFAPQDARIVTDAPELRRAWLDRAAFTLRPGHLARVRSYQRVLAQKAALLRSDRVDSQLLDALNHQLSTEAAALVHARVETLGHLSPHLTEEHARLSGVRESLSLRYVTAGDGADVGERAAAFSARLSAKRTDELRRRQCLVGPHRDDVRFQLDEHSARRYGSRGQIRSLMLAAKLAELVVARERGITPVFLLDDLSSELDEHRTARLIERLFALDSQVFVTTTDPSHMRRVAGSDGLILTVEAGRLRQTTD